MKTVARNRVFAGPVAGARFVVAAKRIAARPFSTTPAPSQRLSPETRDRLPGCISRRHGDKSTGVGWHWNSQGLGHCESGVTDGTRLASHFTSCIFVSLIVV